MRGEAGKPRRAQPRAPKAAAAKTPEALNAQARAQAALRTREAATANWPSRGPSKDQIESKPQMGWLESREFADSVIKGLDRIHRRTGNPVDVALALQSAIGGRVIDGVDLFWIIVAYGQMQRGDWAARPRKSRLSQRDQARLNKVVRDVLRAVPDPRKRAAEAKKRLDLSGPSISLPTIREKFRKPAG